MSAESPTRSTGVRIAAGRSASGSPAACVPSSSALVTPARHTCGSGRL
ncbi:MAG: hypothetical protein HN641_13825 [Candidatus Marinimicrobia bacterium]|nr:hypothetical protein [Candidatus Neomarinimicrobiota bacterium]